MKQLSYFMKFKFLEKVAIADVAFEAYGKNLKELFENCAMAVAETMAEVKTVEPKIKKEVKLENEKIDQLLFDFIGELIYLKDRDAFVFNKFKIDLKKNKLKAICYGDKINMKKQKLRNDIKAITYHMYKVEKVKEGYKATIVLDV